VVYNHTGQTKKSNFNLEVPGYYYRHNKDSSYSNASGCGNETASERTMMRKFMIESIKYWVKEYHIDGFRFDLMGIHDIETMNRIATAVKKLNTSCFIYGEGWTAGDSPLSENIRAVKKNTHFMKQISAFSDDLRDGLKGSVFEEKSTGFVTGAKNMEESIKFGVVGAIYHDQIVYPTVNYSDTVWASQPWQAVSYVSCHDNLTLFDKLNISQPNASQQEIKDMHKLANAIVLTSQGIPFLHAGVEMMRTKQGEHNSYNLPDKVNRIDWGWKSDNKDVFDYYKAIIDIRKNHPAFFMPAADGVREHLKFFKTQQGLLGFTITGNANGDSWSEILIYYNVNHKAKYIDLHGDWNLAVLGKRVNEKGMVMISEKIKIPGISMMIAFR
ncbi:MAG: type I pullulanase, partial [Bacteroidota bacterium]|nr:type I pullulanase [Bacteroidota bacterium]